MIEERLVRSNHSSAIWAELSVNLPDFPKGVENVVVVTVLRVVILVELSAFIT